MEEEQIAKEFPENPFQNKPEDFFCSNDNISINDNEDVAEGYGGDKGSEGGGASDSEREDEDPQRSTFAR